jgi:hypothetical protein
MDGRGRLQAGPVQMIVGGFVVVGVLLFGAFVLTGVLVVVALAIVLAALNLLYLPRAAAWLHVRESVLAVALLPLLVAAGLLLSGLVGGAWGAGLWIAAIGLPRRFAQDVRRRLRTSSGSVVYYEIQPRDPSTPTTSTTHPAVRPLPPAADPGPGESDL